MLMLLSKNLKFIFLTVNIILLPYLTPPNNTWGLDKLAILEDKYGNGDNPDIGCSALESECKSIKHFVPYMS